MGVNVSLRSRVARLHGQNLRPAGPYRPWVTVDCLPKPGERPPRWGEGPTRLRHPVRLPSGDEVLPDDVEAWMNENQHLYQFLVLKCYARDDYDVDEVEG